MTELRHRHERIFSVVQKVTAPLHRGRYIHWDKLRRLAPPGDLSHREWWAALKMNRAALLKDVPLRDKEGRPFSYVLCDPAPELLHHIDQGAGGRIEFPELITNPHTRDRYIVSSLVEEAIRSSQLEGALTTRDIAKDMIRAQRHPKDKSEQMILNNFRTMQRIRSLRQEALTPELVFELHRMLTASTLDDASAAGRLRRPADRVRVQDAYNEVFHDPPAAEELDNRLAAMCDFANGRTPNAFVHPVLRAIILHFWLAYDHPFVDGNGRCARALFYWSMLRHNYWLCEYLAISQIIRNAPVRYYRAFLYTETDENDLTYFILYHLDVIQKAIDALNAYLVRKMQQVRQTERLLRGMADLNHRQRDLISHALRHPDARYSIESHRSSHGVVYQTARTDLLGLARKRFFDARRIGKTWYFYPAKDLETRLSGSGDLARR